MVHFVDSSRCGQVAHCNHIICASILALQVQRDATVERSKQRVLYLHKCAHVLVANRYNDASTFVRTLLAPLLERANVGRTPPHGKRVHIRAVDPA